MSVSFQTSSTRSAKTNSSAASSPPALRCRSLRLPSGSTTVLMLARCAAITFSLMPPTESTLPRSVISPGHGHVVAHGTLPHHRGDAGGDGHAGGRAVLRDRAGREVDVDVVLAELLVVDLQVVRLRAHVRIGGRDRLAHDVAELAGDGGPSAARHARGLDEHDLAAELTSRPGRW